MCLWAHISAGPSAAPAVSGQERRSEPRATGLPSQPPAYQPSQPVIPATAGESPVTATDEGRWGLGGGAPD